MEFTALQVTGIMFLSALFLIGTGLPIVYCLGAVGTLSAIFIWGEGALDTVYFATLDLSSNIVLVVCPLFMFMGFVLHESRIAKDLFDAVYVWSGRVRGALGIGTMLICAMMAAMLGVSSATVLSMGIIAVPAMLHHKYDKKLSVGIVMAGGTLGFLIPPSIMMVMYAFITGTSVGKLFAGGVVPGLILAGIYMAYVGIIAWLKPEYAPALPEEEQVPFKVKLKSLNALLMPCALIFSVMGCIFCGITTPTEAAAMGAMGAVICAIIKRRFSWKMIHAACTQTFALSGFVAFVVIASLIFSKVYSGLGATVMLKRYIIEIGANPMLVMIFIQLSFIFLGCFIDDIAILFMTMPIYYPIVTALGFDPVWFGVLFVVNMQMAYITPPYGLNLFYMKAVAPDSVSLRDIYWAVIPFLIIQLLFLVFCTLCPEIITWLPKLIFN